MTYKRTKRQILQSLLHRTTYYSVVRARAYRNVWSTFVWRYLLGRGPYPTMARMRVSGQPDVAIKLRSRFDVLTVHEIFVWRCYPCTSRERVVVDLGANAGISMLYYLSNSPEAYVVGVEPLPGNVAIARQNLSPFGARCCLIEAAVMDYEGLVEFFTEESGRYSGLALTDGRKMIMKCIDINDLIVSVVSQHGRIDLLKIDIEGAEGVVLSHLSKENLAAIDSIAVEGEQFSAGRLRDEGFGHAKHVSGVHWFKRVPGGSNSRSTRSSHETR